MAEFDLGFLGGGQLARMSIQAAQRMGLKCLSLDPGSETPASEIAASIVGPLDDPVKIREIFQRCERITLENEFIPAAAIREASTNRPILPGIETLATIQDKLLQRRALAKAGVPSPRAFALEDWTPTFPAVLKARFGGYDGKGTRYARTAEEFESHRSLFKSGGWLAEDFVPFARELAVMVVRTSESTFALPTMETIQANHVCDLVFPAWRDASEIAIAAVEAVEGFGLYGVELFEGQDGSLSVNELAPRPHNTGHYTLDWGAPSQFDLHVRAVAGLPVEHPAPTCQSVMANLLGQEGAGNFRLGVRAALEFSGVRVHWYGKAESRQGRKMGHLNVVGSWETPTGELLRQAVDARDAFYQAWTEL